MRHDVKRETLGDLIVIDVCISCDDYPFLDSGLWHSAFHRLTIEDSERGHTSAQGEIDGN